MLCLSDSGRGRRRGENHGRPVHYGRKTGFYRLRADGNVRLTEAQKQAAVQVLENIPFVPTERVTQLSVLLFMAVGL